MYKTRVKEILMDEKIRHLITECNLEFTYCVYIILLMTWAVYQLLNWIINFSNQVPSSIFLSKLIAANSINQGSQNCLEILSYKQTSIFQVKYFL